MNMGSGIMRLGFVGLPSVLLRGVSVDPIAEDYPQLSSYNYAGNKPITYIDIEGLQSQGDSSPKNEQGGAIRDGSGNLTGEFIVKPGQGPTQIAKELKEIHGVDIDWVKTIDDPRNQKYFEHITGEERYNEHNKSYENLNMNPGDIIYFDPSGLSVSSHSSETDNLSLQESVQNPEQLPEVPFDSDYEMNLIIQPDIENKKHEIQQNELIAEKMTKRAQDASSRADSVGSIIEIVNKSTLKKTPYSQRGTGQIGFTFGQTILQDRREAIRDSYRENELLTRDSIADIKLKNEMIQLDIEIKILKGLIESKKR